MRITVNIDEESITESLKLTKAKTKSSAISQAVHEWLSWKKRQEIKTFRGKLPLEDHLPESNRLETERLERLNRGGH